MRVVLPWNNGRGFGLRGIAVLGIYPGMVVVANGKRWVARASYDDRVVLKACGWRWDPDAKAWWTDDQSRLQQLQSRVEVEQGRAEQLRIEIPSSWDGHPSCAVDGPMDIPCPPELAYLPYQRGGIAFARGLPGVLVADEMGLGKTIQAIGMLNDRPARTVLVLCPSSLKLNWQREIDKWLNYYLPVTVIDSGKARWPSKDGVVVMNYDLLKKFPQVKACRWDVLICDEAHYLKSPKAQRTQLALGEDGRGGIPAQRRIFLTGTPAESRPAELFPILNALRPDLFPSWTDYAFRYCAGRMTAYGLDARGSSNSAELQALLRGSIMVRRRKADVLKDLPAKIRRQVLLPCSGDIRKKVDADMAAWKREKAIMDKLRERNADPEEVRAQQVAANLRMHDLRQATTLAKLPMCLEFIRDAAESEKVVVFAKHRAVLDQLVKMGGDAGVVVHGGVDARGRQEAVDRFQSDPECRFFFGNIQAAGVGLTLTAASHVIFVEFDWRPGMMQQAEDRCHRIGQKDSVTCSYLVVENSLDDLMLGSMEKRISTLDAVLDV